MTRLAAENPDRAQLQALGGAELLWAGARDALFVALTGVGVPGIVAGPLADAGVVRVREMALPHIVAVTVEVGEGITINGQEP